MIRVLVEIDNDGERLDCLETFDVMNEMEFTFTSIDKSSVDVYNKIKDNSPHHYDVFITTDKDVSGIDTTGIQPYMSFDGILFNRNIQVMPEGLHEHYLIRKVGV
jgi:hypothetical protein